jgi:hypothetical protein
MFIEASILIAKRGEKLKCPLVNEWRGRMWTMEYYAAATKRQHR